MEVESLADGVDLSEPLTRARFEELVGDLLKKTLGPVRKVPAQRRAPLCHCFTGTRTGARHIAGATKTLGGLRADVCLICCHREGALCCQPRHDLDKPRQAVRLCSGGVWWHLCICIYAHSGSFWLILLPHRRWRTPT